MIVPQQSLQDHLAQPPQRKDEEWRYVDFQFLKPNPYTLFESQKSNTIQVLQDQKKIIIHLEQGNAQKWEWVGTVPGLRLRSCTPSTTGWSYENYFSALSPRLNLNSTELIFAKDFPADYLVELNWPTDRKSGDFQHLSLSLTLEAGAQVRVLERSQLVEKSFLNLDVYYEVGKNSLLTLFNLEKGESQGRSCQTHRFRLHEKSQLQVTTLTGHTTWSRHNLYATMVGAHADVRFVAASLAEKDEFIDHHTWIDHQVGETTSLQKYTTVLNGQAHAVFNGKVFIHQDAQLSAAEQNHRTLLLSKKAHVDTKPELLIEADDVKAKHGATVGQINEEELFYLQSRGIDKNIAREWLVKSFLAGIAIDIPDAFQGLFDQELKLMMASSQGTP